MLAAFVVRMLVVNKYLRGFFTSLFLVRTYVKFFTFNKNYNFIKASDVSDLSEEQ